MIDTILDGYIWRVRLADGSVIGEYDETRLDGRGFLEVASQSVRVVEILSLSQPTISHSTLVPDGAEPVFFRRRLLEINLNTGTQRVGQTVHSIGWQRGEEGSYLFVFEDGSTLLSEHKQAV